MWIAGVFGTSALETAAEGVAKAAAAGRPIAGPMTRFARRAAAKGARAGGRGVAAAVSLLDLIEKIASPADQLDGVDALIAAGFEDPRLLEARAALLLRAGRPLEAVDAADALAAAFPDLSWLAVADRLRGEARAAALVAGVGRAADRGKTLNAAAAAFRRAYADNGAPADAARLAGLRALAERESLALDAPAEDELAAETLETARVRLARRVATPDDLAAGGEAAIALGETAEAERCLRALAQHADLESRHLAGAAHRLIALWGATPGEELAGAAHTALKLRTALTTLGRSAAARPNTAPSVRAAPRETALSAAEWALIERAGQSADTRDAAASALANLFDLGPNAEAALGLTGALSKVEDGLALAHAPRALLWSAAAFAMACSAGPIVKKGDPRQRGVGFLAKGALIRPDLGDRPVLVTAASVVRGKARIGARVAHGPEPLTPDDAEITLATPDGPLSCALAGEVLAEGSDITVLAAPQSLKPEHLKQIFLIDQARSTTAETGSAAGAGDYALLLGAEHGAATVGLTRLDSPTSAAATGVLRHRPRTLAGLSGAPLLDPKGFGLLGVHVGANAQACGEAVGLAALRRALGKGRSL